MISLVFSFSPHVICVVFAIFIVTCSINAESNIKHSGPSLAFNLLHRVIVDADSSFYDDVRVGVLHAEFKILLYQDLEPFLGMDIFRVVREFLVGLRVLHGTIYSSRIILHCVSYQLIFFVRRDKWWKSILSLLSFKKGERWLMFVSFVLLVPVYISCISLFSRVNNSGKEVLCLVPLPGDLTAANILIPIKRINIFPQIRNPVQFSC
ncbi:PREDICTED: uncharacterized protein LOC104807539 isoform X1 [Tarenaya hassleriana]|uniref:uncharacterized protein LOC104807539 isoform X1 n=1 Tax=Tarenaya hassleriana TaxID=28532 RepID=UPI00053C8BB8|nr:PREDICTED: uncharacterized protein LOC104807539 isoform X1 [Tarenaya hassleriana]